jgi:hypothetical protein
MNNSSRRDRVLSTSVTAGEDWGDAATLTITGETETIPTMANITSLERKL